MGNKTVKVRCMRCEHPISAQRVLAHNDTCFEQHRAKGERRTLRGGKTVYNTWEQWKKLEEKHGTEESSDNSVKVEGN